MKTKTKEVEMIEEMTEEQIVTEERMMIEKWVKKNKPKRYTHGERPEGMEPPTISSWGRRKKKSNISISNTGLFPLRRMIEKMLLLMCCVILILKMHSCSVRRAPR